MADRRTEAAPRPPVPFVLGIKRSGSGLLRELLDSHPALAVAPKTAFIPKVVHVLRRRRTPSAEVLGHLIASQPGWEELGIEHAELTRRLAAHELLDAESVTRCVFSLYGERRGKPRWGGAAPAKHLRRMGAIREALPEARFLHVVRDGRDVTLAVRNRSLRNPDIGAVAGRWKHAVERAREQARPLGGYLEVRYEDLVADTKATLDRVCEFCDLPYDEAMLQARDELPRTPRIERWRSEMSADERAEFEAVAGDALASLGYDVAERAGPAPYAPRRPALPRRLAFKAGGTAVRALRTLRPARTPDHGPAPFVVSATRSGSTLMRLMLDSHSEMAIPLETHFVPTLIKARRWERAGADRLAEIVIGHGRWGDFHLDPEELRRRFAAVRPLEIGEVIRAFYRLYAEKQGKPRWGDKTPGYVREMLRIQSALPEARFIHLIRDGRDVALSVLGMEWGADTVERAAERWRKRVERGREQAPKLRHYLEVRYEDLILDTEATLRRVCDFLELPFEEEMLRYYERAPERLKEKARDLHRGEGRIQPAERRLESHALTTQPPNPKRIDRWRHEMSPADLAAFEAVAGALLADLGYELRTGVSAGGA